MSALPPKADIKRHTPECLLCANNSRNSYVDRDLTTVEAAWAAAQTKLPLNELVSPCQSGGHTFKGRRIHGRHSGQRGHPHER